jgi:biotin carboxyl carrier protein
VSRRRYFVRGAAGEVPLEVERSSDGEFRVHPPGGADPVQVSVLSRGATVALLVDGRPVEVRRGARGFVEVHPTRETLAVGLRSSATRARAGAADAGRIVSAPMPGRIVKVVATEGASVVPGDPLIVIEAMKMENELSATRAGIVKRVLVQAGATVERDAPLLELE